MHDRVGMCEIKLEVCQNEVVDTQVYVVLLDATHMRDQLLRHTALILRQLWAYQIVSESRDCLTFRHYDEDGACLP